jgi:arginine utilization protein RocB
MTRRARRSVFRSARYYQARAEEAAAVADKMTSDAARTTWRNIARGYEKLAEFVDRSEQDLEAQVRDQLRYFTDLVARRGQNLGDLDDGRS